MYEDAVRNSNASRKSEVNSVKTIEPVTVMVKLDLSQLVSGVS